jgi:hypothetical protein
MSEEDVRDGLLNAVADEPPLRLDPDELVTTARKQVRRRALAGVGVATVAVAVAAVAVPVLLGRDSGTAIPAAEQPSGRTTSQAPATTTEQWPPAGVKPAHYSADDLRDRGIEMRTHLISALPSALPSASDFVVGEFGGEASGQFYPGQTSINTAITFTIDGKRYSLMITSWAQGAATAPTDNCVADCRRLDDTANGPLYEQTDLLDNGGAIETVFHYRDTGAMVSVAAYNYDMTSQVPPTYHPSLPVTGDQIQAIATDPDLEL